VILTIDIIQACSSQGPSEMEEDCIESQGPQQTAVLEKNKIHLDNYKFK
jgi:hypothetical protein